MKKYVEHVIIKLTEKEVGANFDLLTRQAPNHFGHMLPHYKL